MTGQGTWYRTGQDRNRGKNRGHDRTEHRTGQDRGHVKTRGRGQDKTMGSIP